MVEREDKAAYEEEEEEDNNEDEEEDEKEGEEKGNPSLAFQRQHWEFLLFSDKLHFPLEEVTKLSLFSSGANSAVFGGSLRKK